MILKVTFFYLSVITTRLFLRQGELRNKLLYAAMTMLFILTMMIIWGPSVLFFMQILRIFNKV